MAADLDMMQPANLPDKCALCPKEFDKKDKEQYAKWQVVVYNAQRKVHLVCPECWEKYSKDE